MSPRLSFWVSSKPAAARASKTTLLALMTALAMSFNALSARADAGASVPDAGSPDGSAALAQASAVEAHGSARAPNGDTSIPRKAETSEQSATPDAMANEAELAALLADVPGIAADTPSLQLYGFADMNIMRPYLDKKNATANVANQSAFAVGNVNLYLASNLTHGFSSLIEVRFTYMPSGTFDPTGKVETTYAMDASSFGRYDRWGGIILQRVHLDYSYNGLLNIRVGQFLTPYGIWNVDHGSPTVISTVRPYPIGNAYFPERQVGMEVFGSHLIKNMTVGYHLTLSNGRGDIETSDFDKNKALGGRLFLATDVLGSLKVGLSAYGGRATRDVRVGISAGEGQPVISTKSSNQYDEFALAADLVWTWKGLHIQGEGIISQIRYTEEGRRLRTSQLGAPLGLVADHVAWAWYGLAGYRFPWLSTMPYVLIDQFHHAPGAGPFTSYEIGNRATGYNFGLNVRPIPSVVLKAQFSYVKVPSTPHSDAMLVGGQVAWAF
jgi:hypothetical protein